MVSASGTPNATGARSRKPSSGSTGSVSQPLPFSHHYNAAASMSSASASAGCNNAYMIINEHHSKFDIDNIVIPYDMLVNTTKVNIARNQEIPVPSWRNMIRKTL
jgi:hypothetical protein